MVNPNDWLKGVNFDKVKGMKIAILKKKIYITEFNYLRIEEHLKKVFGDQFYPDLIENYVDSMIDMFFININK